MTCQDVVLRVRRKAAPYRLLEVPQQCMPQQCMPQQALGTTDSPVVASRRLLHFFALELSARHHAL